jgi:hypothetical protein
MSPQLSSVNANGHGQVTVDVNAPKGTRVGAEGGWPVKAVELSLETQIERRARGRASAKNDGVQVSG